MTTKATIRAMERADRGEIEASLWEDEIVGEVASQSVEKKPVRDNGKKDSVINDKVNDVEEDLPNHLKYVDDDEGEGW